MNNTIYVKKIRHNNEEQIKELSMRCSNSNNMVVEFSKDIFNYINEKAVSDFKELMNGNLNYDTHWGRTHLPYNKSFVFENVNDLTLDFGGATLMCHGLVQAFQFKNCKNVTLKNLTIDFERSPFSLGEILKVENDTVQVRVYDDFPVKGGEPVWAYMDFLPKDNRMGLLYKFRNMTPFKLVDKQIVEFSGRGIGKLTPGNEIIMRHIGNHRPCIHLLSCENVKIENVTIYNNPGMGITGHWTKDITVRNLKVIPKGNHRMSTTTDATHFITCSGLIDFENCQFEGMGDDAVNVHGFYKHITKIINPRTVEVTIMNENGTQDMIFDAPLKGDTVEFNKVDDLHVFSENEVKNVEVNEAEWKAIVEFEEELSGDIKVGDIFTSSNDVAKLRFVNCKAQRIRARAALVQTRGAIIEGCRFHDCTGTGIHVDTATGWWESISRRDIVIRNNEFINCGYGDGTYNEASGVAVLTECEIGSVGIHKNIIIENNRIEGCGYKGIYISSCEDVVVRNNEINNCKIAVEVDTSTGVEIYENKTDGKVLIKHKREVIFTM